jgi:hypothetical protein
LKPVLTTAIKHGVDERIYFSDFLSLVGDVCEIDVGIYRVTLSCILQIVQGHREVPDFIAAVENCASISRDCCNRRVVGYPTALSRGYGKILSRDAGARQGSRGDAVDSYCPTCDRSRNSVGHDRANQQSYNEPGTQIPAIQESASPTFDDESEDTAV